MSFKPGQRFLVVPTGDEAKPERPLPSRGRQAINFGRAILRAGMSALNGNPLTVSEETVAARQAICEACEFFRPSDGRCAHRNCGCFTSERRIIAKKTELFSEFCPDEPAKWGPGEISNRT